jgi:hypothetical protein
LGLFKFISDLPYFEKINIFSNIIAKKVELIYTKIEINPFVRTNQCTASYQDESK